MKAHSRSLCFLCARRSLTGLWFLAAAGVLVAAAGAAGPRALPEGKLPEDKRLGPLKDLNGYFPFTPPATRAEWEKRSEQLRRRMLVSQGLWPMPSKTPLNPVIHGRIDQGDYTVEKAYFESAPGFFVSGNLYRPKKSSGKLAGVLSPHGHWANGRFTDSGVQKVRQEIVRGAERFENGGRSPLQSRCVQLARMGCAVFHYDMIGAADSQQISGGISHGFSKQRPEMNAPENWGFYSPQAESHAQSIMGLQTLSSIRALDFLSALPDVDATRILVTGASGGGTQTFMLSALDPRVTVSVPAVMVSTAMQGGCTCENACLLRIDCGNVDFAALFAPKPLCLPSAEDWTREMDTKGFPELKRLYELVGAPSHVKLVMLRHFDHNYNYVSRSAMYDWANTHLGIKLPTPVVEEDYPRLDADKLTVWDAKHPQPEGGAALERNVLRWWTDDARKQLDAIRPQDAASLQKYKELVGGAIDVIVGRSVPAGADLSLAEVSNTETGDFRTIVGLLSHKPKGEQLPVVILQPKQASARAVVWLHKDGKSGLFQDNGQPQPAVRRLLAAGATVVGVDLLYQGEFLAHGQPLTKTRRVENPREAAAYTFGYNPTVFAQRVHDVLSVVGYLRQRSPAVEVCLLALDGAGPWAAAARAQARDAVAKAVIDTGGFRFGGVREIHSPDFLPAGAKYDDLPGLLVVAAPAAVWLAGEGVDGPPLARSAYRAAGAPDKLVAFAGEISKKTDAAVDWLLAQGTKP
jgi:dienelactone hydrolase